MQNIKSILGHIQMNIDRQGSTEGHFFINYTKIYPWNNELDFDIKSIIRISTKWKSSREIE